jgi:hypothetical protein
MKHERTAYTTCPSLSEVICLSTPLGAMSTNIPLRVVAVLYSCPHHRRLLSTHQDPVLRLWSVFISLQPLALLLPTYTRVAEPSIGTLEEPGHRHSAGAGMCAC